MEILYRKLEKRTHDVPSSNVSKQMLLFQLDIALWSQCCFYRLVTSWYLVISSSTNG